MQEYPPAKREAAALLWNQQKRSESTLSTSLFHLQAECTCMQELSYTPERYVSAKQPPLQLPTNCSNKTHVLQVPPALQLLRGRQRPLRGPKQRREELAVEILVGNEC